MTPPPHWQSLRLRNIPPMIRGVPPLPITRCRWTPFISPSHATVLGTPLLASFLGSTSHTTLGIPPPPPPPPPPPSVNMKFSIMPFTKILNLPDLSKLINDPVAHDPTWPTMPAKLPSNIPNFEGKSREDPSNHIMTFHLWFFSNHITKDSI